MLGIARKGNLKFYTNKKSYAHNLLPLFDAILYLDEQGCTHWLEDKVLKTCKNCLKNTRSSIHNLSAIVSKTLLSNTTFGHNIIYGFLAIPNTQE